MQKSAFIFLIAAMTIVGGLVMLGVDVGAADKIYARKGVPVEGTVTEISPQTVVLDKGGVGQKFPANEILKVAFEDEPDALVKARDAAIGGQLEAALKDLTSLAGTNFKRDEIRQEYEFYKGYCEAKIALASGGNMKQADETLFGFVKTNRTSFHMFEATEMLGHLAVAQGDWDKAAKMFSFLGRAPWPDYQLRASVFEARALTSQKDFAKALEKYELVMKNEDSSPEAGRQKMLAKVGKAVCLAETGKPDAAITLVEEIIKNQDSKDAVLFARAYNALGRSHLKQKKTKEALLDYLHVDTLFFSDSEAHAEALFYLSKLWSDVSKADRAIAARTLLQQRYGGSVWAKGL